MSTVMIDAELYRWATEAAAAQGETVDEFVDEVLRKALSKVGIRQTIRHGLPVIAGGPPSILPKCASA